MLKQERDRSKEAYHELELSYEKMKRRSLENAPIQQIQPTQTNLDTPDMSLVKRLDKCRKSVGASTDAIKELRRRNEDLREELKLAQEKTQEAIADVDEVEKVAEDCQLRLKEMSRVRVEGVDGEEVLPPPPPI